jgi:hypothetical protein
MSDNCATMEQFYITSNAAQLRRDSLQHCCFSGLYQSFKILEQNYTFQKQTQHPSSDENTYSAGHDKRG